MKLKEIIKILGARVIRAAGDDLDNIYIPMACGSDLMSDVLSFIKPGSLLLTGLTTEQVIYTAEMADIKVICFVRGKRPDEKIIELADKKNITLLVTDLPMFESCGRLYIAGMKGCSELSKVNTSG
jgi:predicted transcriptional regulator